MTVIQKVIKETAEMIKLESEFQTVQFMKIPDAQATTNNPRVIEIRANRDMTEYFARQIAHIFTYDGHIWRGD